MKMLMAWLYGLAVVIWTVVYGASLTELGGAGIDWIITALTLIAWGLLAVVVALVADDKETEEKQ